MAFRNLETDTRNQLAQNVASQVMIDSKTDSCVLLGFDVDKSRHSLPYDFLARFDSDKP